MLDPDKMLDEIENHDYGERPEGPSTIRIQSYVRKSHAAMLEFVRRCEEGSIRSTYTYNLFKQILEIE